LKKNNEIKDHFEKLKENYDKVEKKTITTIMRKKKGKKKTIIRMKKQKTKK